MKSTKLALVIVLSCGILFACKQEPAPAVDAMPPPAMDAPAVTPEPMVPDMTMPAPIDPAAADSMEDEDMPHSGGDRVGTGGAPTPEN